VASLCLQALRALFTILFVISCSGDPEPPPPHEAVHWDSTIGVGGTGAGCDAGSD
jgi:hypothetical protein